MIAFRRQEVSSPGCFLIYRVMKKNKKKKIKISTNDKVQALTRNTKFIEDLKHTIYPFSDKKGFSLKKQKAFMDRYGVSLPRSDTYNSLEECIELTKQSTLLTGFKDDFIARLIPSEDAELMEYKISNKELKKIFPFSSKGKIRKEDMHYHVYNKPPFIWNEKYLRIEIDLTKDRKKIIDRITYYIKLYEKYVNKKVAKEKKTKYDIWEVYDLHKKDNLTKTQIARRLSGETGNPTFNPKLMAALQKVRRAYNKACQIVSQVDEELMFDE